MARAFPVHEGDKVTSFGTARWHGAFGMAKEDTGLEQRGMMNANGYDSSGRAGGWTGRRPFDPAKSASLAGNTENKPIRGG